MKRSRILCFSEKDGVGIEETDSGELIMFAVDMRRPLCWSCGGFAEKKLRRCSQCEHEAIINL